MPEAISAQHRWVGATHIPLDDRQARWADNRGSVRVTEGLKVEVLEVYCFDGGMEFLTPDGPRRFDECADTTQTVLTQRFKGDSRRDGYWVDAEIRQFGEQPLVDVALTRNRVTKTIRATPGHRWFAANASGGKARTLTTAGLQPGMMLESLTPRFAIRQSIPSPFGIAHGIVYGDGSRKNQRGVTEGTGANNRLRWRVESVTDRGAVEPVFCATVPETGTFALADYIWTHNCSQCKRVFEDVVGTECVAADTTEHLRGGPIGERRSRKHPWHDCNLYSCTAPLPAGFTREARR